MYIFPANSSKESNSNCWTAKDAVNADYAGRDSRNYCRKTRIIVDYSNLYQKVVCNCLFT